MNRKRWIAGGALALAVVGGTTGFAIANAGDDQPLTGSALDEATAAALAHTGGGTVIESEAGDDGAAYGVEIRLDDGRVVEVALDANFDVIGSGTDEDGTGAEDDAGGGDSGQDD
jgi:Peptidase propeptide and YPEB domain